VCDVDITVVMVNATIICTARKKSTVRKYEKNVYVKWIRMNWSSWKPRISTVSSSIRPEMLEISPQEEGAHLKQSLRVIRFFFFLLIIVLSCVNTRHKGISGSPADDNNHWAPARGTNNGYETKTEKREENYY